MFQDRTYHGIDPSEDIDEDVDDWPTPRLLVEEPATGPTERESVRVIRELHPKDAEMLGGFGWGYNGSGTSRAATAVLADALDLDPAKTASMNIDDGGDDDILVALREDFSEDVLMQMCSEWRLPRGAVLRWVRGWYAQRGTTNLPAAVRNLPPLVDL